MSRVLVAAVAVISLFAVVPVVAQTLNPAPETAQRLCDLEEAVGIGPYDECAPPTTTTSTTTTTTTTTTTVPVGGVWSEDFATPASLDRFEIGVYHRNVDSANFPNFSGGSWFGDHAPLPGDACEGPDTRRELSWQPGEPRDIHVYWCDLGTGHLMTTMGDVDLYSIVSFTPNDTFVGVAEIRWDVNVTALGDSPNNRQFTEVKVIPAAVFDVHNLPCAVELPCGTDDMGTLGAVGVSSHHNALRFNNGTGPSSCSPSNDPEGLASKAIRREHVLTDNGDGTVTYAVEGRGACTFSGSFPAGPVRVVFADHSYTPEKDCGDAECPGYTWHWDDIEVHYEGS